MAKLGANVEYEIKGDIMTIKIDLSQVQGPSASKKTNVIATTSGNKPLPHQSGAVIGLTVFTKDK